VVEASGSQAAGWSWSSGLLIQAASGRLRIFGLVVLVKRSGVGCAGEGRVAGGGDLVGEPVVDVGGGVQADPGVVVGVVVPVHELGDEVAGLAQAGDPVGEGRGVLQGLEPGLGVGVVVGDPGREWERVTFRSDSKVATVLDVIEVPRSARTTWGMPWTPRTSLIISSASGPVSRPCTCAPTMYRE
jgi:hypothetical protein